ncbi:PTS sugar transporter subunit IIA [Alterisphingorhabdus coralli]|uniref:PTS sugar transporter subunit IIA n=1 Tax=Alterisphingorhabdus coralli TaxID=3071408 RepID=A0AA97F775_9SPHN|nr:PTS sugar transporter subunit IIA [Parasphingorhabdus sp. SCSIO 66989]WOE75461.1 PTS sugar transporter subunit IIA [Parasphingorhabdus sp. SCSIO 66989]
MMYQDTRLLVLDREAVVTGLAIANKKQLFDIIAEQFAHIYGLDRQQCLDLLSAREDMGSTGFGRGIAIPHARIEGITRPVALFLQLDQSIDYMAVDSEPVDLVWAMLSPANQGALHLRALAHVSRLLRDEALVSQLRGADDGNAIHALLGEKLQRKAA